jgi:hypothetical protein
MEFIYKIIILIQFLSYKSGCQFWSLKVDVYFMIESMCFYGNCIESGTSLLRVSLDYVVSLSLTNETTAQWLQVDLNTPEFEMGS